MQLEENHSGIFVDLKDASLVTKNIKAIVEKRSAEHRRIDRVRSLDHKRQDLYLNTVIEQKLNECEARYNDQMPIEDEEEMIRNCQTAREAFDSSDV